MVHDRSQKWPGPRPPSKPNHGLWAAWAECGFSLKAEIPQVLLEAQAQVYTPTADSIHTLCALVVPLKIGPLHTVQM